MSYLIHTSSRTHPHPSLTLSNAKPKAQMANFLLPLPLLLLAASISSPAAADNSLLYAGCSQSKYDADSAYKTDVDSLLSSFADAASTSSFGNFTSAAASGSSPVYGLFQCRGDLPPPSCQSCIRSALSRLSPTCPLASGAALQLDGCFLRYGSESFLGKEETNLLYKRCGPLPPRGYDPNLMGMRDDALQAIASSGGTGGTYRVGASGFVQAGVQCVGDLDPTECSDCISTAVDQLKSACGDAISGDVYLGKCFAKYYSNGAYFSSFDDNGNHDHHHHDDYHDDSAEQAGKTIAIIIGLFAGVALIIVFASFIRRARDSKL